MQSEKRPERERSRKIILDITPQTFIRTTSGDRIFFRIPRDKLFPAGLKRLKRIERYNEYKLNLSAEAKRKHFVPPAQGLSICFYIPCPRTWSKKKKKEHHGRFHQSTPDLDNFLKAWADSLLAEDKFICHYSEIAKRWVDFETGWIEVYTADPTEFAISPPTKE